MEGGSTECYLDQLITLAIQMKMSKMKRWWVKKRKLHNIDNMLTKGSLEVNYERLSLWGCKKSWLYFCTPKSADLTPFYLHNLNFFFYILIYFSSAWHHIKWEKEREKKRHDPAKDSCPIILESTNSNKDLGHM